MIDKFVLQQVILDNRKDVENFQIVEREFDMESFSCYVFVGVRRSGKSCLLFQRMQQLLRQGFTWDDMLYLNFEDERLVGFELSDFNTILECHLEMSDKQPMLFLDEIQNVSGWEKFARRMADTKHTVFITGSNASMLSNELLAALGGRFIPVEVYPFSFDEILKYKGMESDPVKILSTQQLADVAKVFAAYFSWGGLPESVDLKVKRNYLSSTYQKIYLNDICSRNSISNSVALRLLLNKIAESVKQPISYTRLARLLSSIGGKVSVPSIVNYVKSCEDAWLLLRLRNFSASFAQKESNCKYYFVDNGILNLLLIDGNTTLLENLVAVSLFRKFGHDLNNERVFFYNNNFEIDFYVPEEKLAIQVSYSLLQNSDTFAREVDALVKFSKVAECKRKIIITYNEEKILHDDSGDIEVIPAWKWVLLL